MSLTSCIKAHSNVTRLFVTVVYSRNTDIKDSTGYFRFCVEDWHNESVVGHIERNSIEEIWRGTEYERLRELQLSGKYSQIPLCKDCTDWQASPWEFGYEYAINKIYENQQDLRFVQPASMPYEGLSHS